MIEMVQDLIYVSEEIVRQWEQAHREKMAAMRGAIGLGACLALLAMTIIETSIGSATFFDLRRLVNWPHREARRHRLRVKALKNEWYEKYHAQGVTHRERMALGRDWHDPQILAERQLRHDIVHGETRILLDRLWGRKYSHFSDYLHERVVIVKNGSPEPDGSYRTYEISVPLKVRSPAQGIAWSYGVPLDSYREAVRT